MKYLFGDSTEFPMQRDFLGLLDDFIETGVKAVTLENNVLDLKETIINRRKFKNSVLDEMDNFLITVENAISGAVAGSKEQEALLPYSQKSKDFLKKFIEESKAKFSDERSAEIAQLEEKIAGTNEENRKTLESFFMGDPIPIINKKYTIKSGEKGYSAKVLVDYESNISCIFEIASSAVPFWKGHVKAHDFARGIEIPARMKKPFLKKEFLPDIISIDEYYLSDLTLSGKELEIVFKKKLENASERFRLKMIFADEFEVTVYHADENSVEKNIQEVAELKNSLSVLRLRELGEKIVEQANNLYPARRRLECIYLDGRDVLEENLVFELMQKVAEIFAPCVAEIKKHSPSGEELSLKAEDETGKRSEIYLRKSTVIEKLKEIKEKGDRLSQILEIRQLF